MPRADLPRGLLNGDSTHLPALIAALNDESTRLTDKKKPKDAIRAPRVTQKPSSVVPGRPIGLEEPLISSSALVRYVYLPESSRAGTEGRPTLCGR